MRGIAPRTLAPLVSAAALLVAATAAPAALAAGNYVAMGDSYTSAPGVQPAAAGAPPECGRSANNYPHLVAGALGLTLTDVSCGGAATRNFEEAQFEDQPPQFDALSTSTDIVTIGMGGNDGGLFGTLMGGCTELDIVQKRPGKAPCAAAYQSFVTSTFAADRGPQEAALRRVRQLAPHAKVFVVGYPEVTPQGGSCPAFPLYPGDLRWFRNKFERVGNAQFKSVAKTNGAIFVDTFKPSIGHNACTPVGTRWIEPLLESLTGVAVHPNAQGEQQDAVVVEQSMQAHGVQ